MDLLPNPSFKLKLDIKRLKNPIYLPFEQCRFINSLSNMTNSRQFCPTLFTGTKRSFTKMQFLHSKLKI
jgi:hypothetical protein